VSVANSAAYLTIYNAADNTLINATFANHEVANGGYFSLPTNTYYNYTANIAGLEVFGLRNQTYNEGAWTYWFIGDYVLGAYYNQTYLSVYTTTRLADGAHVAIKPASETTKPTINTLPATTTTTTTKPATTATPSTGRLLQHTSVLILLVALTAMMLV
jgi:hypothetical protein